VALARARPGQFVGTPGTNVPITVGRLRGVLLSAGPCGCNRQVPLFALVASDGGARVRWVVAEGPRLMGARTVQLAS
jgi:hypothetical protein